MPADTNPITVPIQPVLMSALTSDPMPGPGARTARGAGQLGGVTVFINLWQAFDWFGADRWTAAQASERWPAIFAVTTFSVVAAHNAVNWWSARRADRAVQVTATGLADLQPVHPKIQNPDQTTD